MTIELTLLGTGGPRPDVKRSQSAMLIVVDGERYLVDCGDGTSSQLLKAGFDPGGVLGLCLLRDSPAVLSRDVSPRNGVSG